MSPPDAALSSLRAVAEALDGLGLAVYVLDEDDRSVLWNRTFLHFFPEHADRIHAGEPYRENLRRFYDVRLRGAERASLERFVEEGIARNRAQTRPFSFEHHGRRLHAASLPMPGIGRLRTWRAEEPGAQFAAPPVVAGVADGLDEHHGTLLDHLPVGLMVTDADLRIQWVNEPFVELYRLPSRTVALGSTLAGVYGTAWEGEAPAERAAFESGLGVLQGPTRYTGAPFELALPRRRWVRVTEQRSPDGRRVFVHVDISALKAQHERLADAERRARDSEAQLRHKSALLEATLQRMEQGIMMVNAERVVEVCNRRAMELLELPESLMAGQPRFEDVLAFQRSRGDFANASPEVQAFIRAGGIDERPHVYDRRRADGRVIEVHSVPVEGGGVLRTYTDITERRRQEERIRHLAHHDGLTALATRDVFRERLAEALRDPQRVREGFAVHFLDLNRFKPINDRHGHAVGDQVLATVARRLRAAARDADVVARMGGDEFAILQFRAAHADAALGLARRVLDALAQPMTIESLTLQVGASIGFALSSASGGDAERLLRSADLAMYTAKASGRDTVFAFEG